MTIHDLQSPEIDKITAALVEAKKNFKPLWADSKSNYKKEGFVGLDSIEDCTRDALHLQGLSTKQGRCVMEGAVMLQTQLIHTSGQWFAYYMPLTMPNPQNTKNCEDRS